MSTIEFRDQITVELVGLRASDQDVVDAARVSTQGSEVLNEEHHGKVNQRTAGLINYLMKNRHGTPFEHNSFTFCVHAPIFVMRELMRHRISSFNEESGRYRELSPVFYVTPEYRNLTQVGKPAHYDLEPGTPEMMAMVRNEQADASLAAWNSYQRQLEAGVAREVARMVLPLNIFSTTYFTVNARSLMNFLSLRVQSNDSRYDTRPMIEIQWLAEQAEKIFANAMPITHNAFVRNGRVAP